MRYIKQLLIAVLAIILWSGFNFYRDAYSGQEGEHQALDLVERMYYGSVDKYTYTLDHRNGVATMDFNMKGNPDMFREYFVLRDRVFLVDTDTERGRVAKLLIEKAPNDFRKCLKDYDKLQELIKKHEYDYNSFNFYFDYIRGNQGTGDYSTVEKETHKINRINKKLFEVYHALPEEVQERIEMPMRHYIVVEVYGYDGGRYYFTDEYPEVDL